MVKKHSPGSPIKMAEMAVKRQSSGRHLRRALKALEKHNEKRGKK